MPMPWGRCRRGRRRLQRDTGYSSPSPHQFLDAPDGLRRVDRRVVLEPDGAGVAAVPQVREPGVPVDGTGTGFAAPRRICDLNILDEVAGVGELGGHVLALDRGVVEVVENAEVWRVDALGDIDGFRGPVQEGSRVVNPDVDRFEDQGDAGTLDVRDASGEDLDQFVQLVLPLAAAESGTAAHYHPGAAELLCHFDAGVQPGVESIVVAGRDHELHTRFRQLGGELDSGFLECVLQGRNVFARRAPHFDGVEAGCCRRANPVSSTFACFGEQKVDIGRKLEHGCLLENWDGWSKTWGG